MLNLTSALENISTDPIRDWIRILKELGAEHMFTIGSPDVPPQAILDLYATAVAEVAKKPDTSYPLLDGVPGLSESIVKTEQAFGVDFTAEDVSRVIPTVGGSQALQFIFSLFEPGSEILCSLPYWGTIANITAHSFNKAVPGFFFERGEFIEENAERSLTEKTQAVYLNYPSNPESLMYSKKAVTAFTNWALSHELQIISDSPYKYHVHDPKMKYYSPINVSSDAYENTIVTSSFSKTIKPDIRLGYMRLSPTILNHPSAKNVIYMFRNLSAGVSREVQAGVKAVLDSDPTLEYLRPIVDGYAAKAKIVQESFEKIGCSLPSVPNAGYYAFVKTPNGEDADDYVKKLAKESKIAFIPGSSFGGAFKGYEHLREFFRVGYGGNWAPEKLAEVLSGLKS